MQADDRVIIKGVRDGLLILLDDSIPWPELVDELDSRLRARPGFFQGATVTLNLGSRVIDEPEFGTLRTLFGGLDMTLDVVVSTSTQTRAVAGVNGVRNRAPAFGRAPDGPSGVSRGGTREVDRPAEGATEPVAAPPSFDGEPNFGAVAGEDEASDVAPDWGAGAGGALFVRRTLRSGMRIHHDGDVCVLGDVNAGAEIVAGGDIVVWGVLRGMVHAGAGGDQAAVVCALLLAPTQLRIADRVSRGSEPMGPVAPEMARATGDGILVEPWSARRK